MSKTRLAPLIIVLVLFGLITAVYVARIIQFKKTHYRVGAIPPEVAKSLLPKDVPLSALRPPALRPIDPIRFGSNTSVISVIEYGDYECEACKQMAPIINKVVPQYRSKVRFVWRDFPIEEIHPGALSAALFVRCSGLQGKFWEAYDALMLSSTFTENVYNQTTEFLGLDPAFMGACRRDPALKEIVRKDVEEARADGIKSVPLIFVGTQVFQGIIDQETLKRAIEKELAS